MAVELNATDVDNTQAEITYTISSDPKHGSYDAASHTYTSDTNFTGTDYFSYTATDPDGLSSIGRVYLTVGNTPAPFITLWKTDLEGNTTATQLKIGTAPYTTYDFTIDWGDGTVEHNITATTTHDYTTAGEYVVMISGTYPRHWVGDYYTNTAYDAGKLLSIEQWGDTAWSSMAYAFYKASQMTMAASDAPDLSAVTNMYRMFHRASAFNQDISSWDVSAVTIMSSMFYGARLFNQSLNNWNVSAVTHMGGMFSYARAFNQPLKNWDVSL